MTSRCSASRTCRTPRPSGWRCAAFERRYLSALLEKSGHNVSSAARAAGVDRSNFRRLLKQYEVVRGPLQQPLGKRPEPMSA